MEVIPSSKSSARVILSRVPAATLADWGREYFQRERRQRKERQQQDEWQQEVGQEKASHGLSEGQQEAKREYTRTDNIIWLTKESFNGPVLDGSWLIKGFLPADGLGVMYGRPGCGKSFLVTDVALRLAARLSWQGLKSSQTSVAYIAAEAGRMGGNRVAAWMKHHDEDWPSSFRMSPVAIDLRSTARHAEALIADREANQPDVGLVIVDTLNRSMGGGDENSAEDMGAFISNCGKVAEALNCFVLTIHHSGKDSSKGSRGHSSLLGAVSTELEVVREQGFPGTVRVTKQRDGEDGKYYGFDLLSVELGHDTDGDPVTSAVIIEKAAEEARASEKPKGKSQVTVVEAFRQYSLEHGKQPPAGTGFPDCRVQAVEAVAFIEFAAAKMVHHKRPERRKAVTDALDGLISRHLMATNGGLLWWSGK